MLGKMFFRISLWWQYLFPTACQGIKTSVAVEYGGIGSRIKFYVKEAQFS